jgi:hypothetical protein
MLDGQIDNTEFAIGDMLAHEHPADLARAGSRKFFL